MPPRRILKKQLSGCWNHPGKNTPPLSKNVSRLSKLYQLRCVTNLPSCDQDSMTKKWLLYSNSAEEDVYRQSTAVCQYLFTNMAEAEVFSLLLVL